MSKIKEFVVKNKKEILIVGGSIIVIGIGVFAIIKFKKNGLEIANKVTASLPNLVKNDLPLPDWKGVTVYNHWFEDNYSRNIILNAPVWELGNLGDNLVKLGANPDIPIEMILSYCEG